MAVLDKLEATISVDGKPLQEYDCDIGDEPEASSTPPIVPKIKKYIESQAGSRFSICLIVHPGQTLDPTATHLSWDTYLDGKYVEGNVVRRSLIGIEPYERTISRVQKKVEGKLHTRHFKFENLDLCELDIHNISMISNLT